MAARCCGEIIALHGGRLIACGIPDDILNTACPRSICDTAQEAARIPASGRPVALAR